MAQKVLTPKEFFDSIRLNIREEDWAVADDVYAKFQRLKENSQFLQPAIEFIKEFGKVPDKKYDELRQWGPHVLSQMKGKSANTAFESLLDLFNQESSREHKQSYRWTRFRALSALNNLSEDLKNQTLKNKFNELISKVAYDDEEYLENQTLSWLVLAKLNFDDSKTKEAIDKIRLLLSKEISNNEKYGFGTKDKKGPEEPALCALNALTQVCLPNERGIREDIETIIKDSPHYRHKTEAIIALGSYKQNKKVIYDLVEIIKTNHDPTLRRLAMDSLDRTKNPQSKDILIECLTDIDPIVRSQAIKSLSTLYDDPETALRIVAQEAMKEEISETNFNYLIEALRIIDYQKTMCVQLLSNDLDSDDQKRAARAQQILAEVGGLASLQKLGRRKTLEASYKALEESERHVLSMFSRNTIQAARGFYFAMAVNIVIVSVGIVLIGLAVTQVIVNPANLSAWIVPGAGGVFGIIITMCLNGPRRNAQQDLAIMMNANMIYLGYLRMINEIDATFKHDFIEKPNFDANITAKAVDGISDTLKKTLDYTSNYLFNPDAKANKRSSSLIPPESSGPNYLVQNNGKKINKK